MKKLVITLNLRDKEDVEMMQGPVRWLLLEAASVLRLPDDLDPDAHEIRDVLGNVVGRVEVS